jgi:hypothetical protein
MVYTAERRRLLRRTPNFVRRLQTDNRMPAARTGNCEMTCLNDNDSRLLGPHKREAFVR